MYLRVRGPSLRPLRPAAARPSRSLYGIRTLPALGEYCEDDNLGKFKLKMPSFNAAFFKMPLTVFKAPIKVAAKAVKAPLKVAAKLAPAKVVKATIKAAKLAALPIRMTGALPGAQKIFGALPAKNLLTALPGVSSALKFSGFQAAPLVNKTVEYSAPPIIAPAGASAFADSAAPPLVETTAPPPDTTAPAVESALPVDIPILAPAATSPATSAAAAPPSSPETPASSAAPEATQASAADFLKNPVILIPAALATWYFLGRKKGRKSR